MGASDEVNVSIYKNSGSIYQHDFMVHSSVDPTVSTFTLIKPLEASDVIEVYLGAMDGVDAVRWHDGTTLNINRIN